LAAALAASQSAAKAAAIIAWFDKYRTKPGAAQAAERASN
jgi:hypothetical protein